MKWWRGKNVICLDSKSDFLLIQRHFHLHKSRKIFGSFVPTTLIWISKFFWFLLLNITWILQFQLIFSLNFLSNILLIRLYRIRFMFIVVSNIHLLPFISIFSIYHLYMIVFFSPTYKHYSRSVKLAGGLGWN